MEKSIGIYPRADGSEMSYWQSRVRRLLGSCLHGDDGIILALQSPLMLIPERLLLSNGKT